jgi:Kef-type K+ transport system membrane component KefB/nucleotide-binding universal stress UspA family protein
MGNALIFSRQGHHGMEPIAELFQDEPIGSFAVLLAVILIVPPLFEKLRLPGVLGLLAAGVALGPNSLNVLSAESPIMTLLAEVGLLYLMFVAGLEIDLAQLRKVKHRSAGFGGLTFSIPLITGIVIGRVFQMDWNASVLMGSLLASHSLMTYPILRRLGVVANQAVTVTIGATIITDIGALIVLAICLGINQGGFSLSRLVALLFSLSLYTLLVLWGFDRIGRAFFRRAAGDEGNQFLFLLLTVFLAALGAQLIGVEKIVGAFLSGLAVNDVVGDGPVKEKVVFVGSVLFIPIFFVNIGLLIDLPAFINSVQAFGLALTIVIGLVCSKFLAAGLAKLSFGYSRQEMLTMGSMSIPQVATTLAATLVGNRAGMLSNDVLNSVVVMMLVTATLGPLLVSRFAVNLPLPATAEPKNEFLIPSTPQSNRPFTVVVPIYNPQTEQMLVGMAALLAQHQAGRIVPLAITVARPHMTRQQLEGAVARSEQLLHKAEDLSRGLTVPVSPLLRIDDQVPLGICRASQEQRASLILMGWSNITGLQAKLFGSIVDSVFWAAPCPVAVVRLVELPAPGHRILVPVENFTERALRHVRFAHLLAEASGAEVTLLHFLSLVHSDSGTQTRVQTQMHQLITQVGFTTPVASRIVPEEDIVRGILQESKDFNLVILHSKRHQTAAEGFGFSSITTQVVQQLDCSTIVLGESHLT